MNKPKRKLTQRLRDKYRLIIYNDNSFEEVGYVRLKGFNLLWIIGALGFILISLVFILIAYTSVRELIPGYPDSRMRREMVLNALRLDSLEHEMQLRDKYFSNINNIISGREPVDYDIKNVDSLKTKNIKFTRSDNDSILRKQVEDEEQYNISEPTNSKDAKPTYNLSQIHFFTPLRGVITSSFNSATNHYGTDIVAGPNEVIKSVLDGTVIMATWTLETGYVIQIQHDNNLVSVYKHNAELLKRAGNRVVAGDAIAIVGNSGELTTGPHLHFELWYNGRPVNPEDYIVF
jgi:murein DD-endopeptidase MepM/ murein hydrolase activator NlpD